MEQSLRLFSPSWEAWVSLAAAGEGPGRRTHCSACAQKTLRQEADQTSTTEAATHWGLWASPWKENAWQSQVLGGRGYQWNLGNIFLSFWLHLQNQTRWVSNFLTNKPKHRENTKVCHTHLVISLLQMSLLVLLFGIHWDAPLAFHDVIELIRVIEMTSKPLSCISNCKREANVGAFRIELVFSQKTISRRWSSKAGLPAGSRPSRKPVGVSLWEGNTFLRRKRSSWVFRPHLQEAEMIDGSTWNISCDQQPLFFLLEEGRHPCPWLWARRPKAAAGTALPWPCRNHPGRSANNQTLASLLPSLSSTFSWCHRAHPGSSPCGASCSPGTGRSSRRH